MLSDFKNDIFRLSDGGYIVEVHKRGCKEYNLEMISVMVAELGTELDFRQVERPCDVEYLILKVHRFEKIRKLRVRLVS